MSEDSNETFKNDNTTKGRIKKVKKTTKNPTANAPPAEINICNEMSIDNTNEPNDAITSSTIEQIQQKENETESVKSSEIIEESSSLLISEPRSLDKLVTVGNADHKDVDDICKSFEKSSSPVNIPAKTDEESDIINIQDTHDNVLNNDISVSATIDSSKMIESTEMVQSSKHNTDQAVEPKEVDINVEPIINNLTDKVSENNGDVKIIDAENAPDILCDNESDNESDDVLNDILKGSTKLNKSNFPLLMKMFSKKELSYEVSSCFKFSKLLVLI